MAKGNSRKDPLLPLSINQSKGNTNEAKFGFCTRTLLLMMPLIGCSLMLMTLSTLVTKMQISIKEMSISQALADYEPTWEILLLLCSGSLAIFIATAARNIQIAVYHQRYKSEFVGLRIVNLIATISHIMAYVGFIILAIYPIDGDYSERHKIGAAMFFGLFGLYSVLHTFLLWKQTQYAIYCKIIMTMVPLASVICSAIFCIKRDEGYEYEWLSVALAALFVGLFFLLFITDRVDDELLQVFCCKLRHT